MFFVLKGKAGTQRKLTNVGRTCNLGSNPGYSCWKASITDLLCCQKVETKSRQKEKQTLILSLKQTFFNYNHVFEDCLFALFLFTLLTSMNPMCRHFKSYQFLQFYGGNVFKYFCVFLCIFAV